MNRLMKLIYSNKLFAFIMLLIQTFIFLLTYAWLKDYSSYLFGATSILSAVLIIIELNRDEQPMFKLTWVLLVAVVPIFGVLLYIYLHAGFITSNIEKAQKSTRERIRPFINQDEEIIEAINEFDRNEGGLVRYLSKCGGSAAYVNTDVRYYPIGEKMLDAIIRELKKAEKFIFLEFFIINQSGTIWPEILDILEQKVKNGVEVRVLYDAMGCLTTLPRNYFQKLESMGIKCREFSPIQPLLSTHQNNRDHRKILVIDGKTAFTGGINLADEYANLIERFGHWKDSGIRLRGEAVAGFTSLFLEMWNITENDSEEDFAKYISSSEQHSTSGEGIVIPYGDSPHDKEYIGKQVYTYMINNAAKYFYIATPYLVVDNEIFEALKFAVHRGVDVKIIMPHIPDKKYAFWLGRTYYPELLKAGVEIYEYAPGFVHSKLAVSDNLRAVVGTINLDFRSLYLHYECAAYMIGAKAIADIEADYKQTLNSCIRITMDEYKQFPLYTKLIGKMMRLVAPLI